MHCYRLLISIVLGYHLAALLINNTGRAILLIIEFELGNLQLHLFLHELRLGLFWDLLHLLPTPIYALISLKLILHFIPVA